MKHQRLKTAIPFWAVSLVALMLSCSTANHMPNRIGGLDPPEGNLTEGAPGSQTVQSPGGNPDSHYLLACYYQEAGRHPEAIEEFRKTLLIDPSHVKAYNGMGVSHDLLGDFAKAAACYEKALQLNPRLDEVQNNLGYSHLLRGNSDEAIVAFKRALALDEKEKRFHNNLGLAYAIKGDLGMALEEFKLAGEVSQAHYNVARFYHEKGLYSLARFHYAAALTLDPSFAHARIALRAVSALARIFNQEPQEAERKDENKSAPFALGKMDLEKPSPLPSSIFSDDLAPERPLQDQRAEDSAQTTLTEVQSRGGTVPIESLKIEPERDSSQQPTPSRSLAREASLDVLQTMDPQKTPESAPSREPDLREKSFPPAKSGPIEISNGNGRNQMARRVGHYLEAKGLTVNRLTNADHFNHPETRIYYQKGYHEAASHLADQLPAVGVKDIREEKRFDRPSIKIKLLIGKDILPYHTWFQEGDPS